jgi:hypothetical protein
MPRITTTAAVGEPGHARPGPLAQGPGNRVAWQPRAEPSSHGDSGAPSLSPAGSTVTRTLGNYRYWAEKMVMW